MTATQRWTLTVVCAATAMLMLDIAVVNTALTAIAADLDTGLSGLQWIVDAYTLTLAATVITAGSLADRFGRRRLFVIGLAIFTAMSLLCGLSQSITMLNVSRGAQGVGAAIMFAVSLAVLSNAFPNPQERVKALAAYGATMPGAFAIGPLVGGALTSGLDWRWIFLINLPLGALCLWIVRKHVAESLDPRAPRVDVPGLLTLTGALFLLVFALLRDGSGLLYGAAAVLAIAFVAIEARTAQPMLPLRLFRNPSFTGAQVGAVGISALAVRALAVPDAVPAAGAGAVGDRGRAGLRARHAAELRRRGRDRLGRPDGAGARARRRRPGADRRGPGGADVDRRGLVLVAVPPRAARRDGRHRHAQPGRRAGRAELGAA